MFEYLSKNEISRVVFDPFQPNVYESAFSSETTDWKYLYGYIKEELHLGMPDPLVNISYTTCFVDANQACNVVTQSSHTGVLVYVMNAPIIWFSKNQNTV